MPVYQLHNQKALLAVAAARGWLEGGREPRVLHDKVPEVMVCDQEMQPRLLAPVAVQSQESVPICLPEAILHGRNMSLLVEDCVFPGALAHSYGHSPAFQPLQRGTLRYEPCVERNIDCAELLGLVCHWGHFFVDALDRLLAREASGERDRPLLISDTDLFSLQPASDDCFAVPQVSGLIRAMGVAWDPFLSMLLPVGKGEDVRVTNLRVRTLCSAKPSMSDTSLRSLRRRVGVPETPSGTGGLVFVGRRAVHKRFVRHQDRVAAQLQELADGRTVFPEFMSLPEAVDCFSAASRVILPIGSAKFNLAFCRPGTRVICVNPKGYSEQPGGVPQMVRHICHALGLRLAFYEVDIEKAPMLLHSNLVFTERDAPAMLDLFDRMA